MTKLKKYEVIYADPPWRFNNKNTGGSMKSGADSHYSTMNLDDICNLPITKMTDNNCILFMWWVATQPMEALKVVNAWGFKLKTMTGFNWVKLTKSEKLFFGMGFWTRAGSEMCLIAIKGNPKRISRSVRSVELAECTNHSKKPDIFKDRILQLCGDLTRIELFARNESKGWDVFGDDVNNSINIDLY